MIIPMHYLLAPIGAAILTLAVAFHMVLGRHAKIIIKLLFYTTIMVVIVTSVYLYRHPQRIEVLDSIEVSADESKNFTRLDDGGYQDGSKLYTPLKVEIEGIDGFYKSLTLRHVNFEIESGDSTITIVTDVTYEYIFIE